MHTTLPGRATGAPQRWMLAASWTGRSRRRSRSTASDSRPPRAKKAASKSPTSLLTSVTRSPTSTPGFSAPTAPKRTSFTGSFLPLRVGCSVRRIVSTGEVLDRQAVDAGAVPEHRAGERLRQALARGQPLAGGRDEELVEPLAPEGHAGDEAHR